MDRARFGFVLRWVAAAMAAGSFAYAQAGQSSEAERQPRGPAGRLTRHFWTSAIFPGTERRYWVYVPAQYRPEAPAAVMVFQDGARFVSEEGRWRVPVLFDELIESGQMPVTIGIFVDPGVLPARSPDQQPRYNRSFEYDGLGERYARFLIDELLPEVGRTRNLTTDPNLRAIAGSSSGGICAFTAAWNRPDAFRRVLSFIGSYTGLRGGDAYPTLIRKTEPRPLRVFVQDGRRDLDIYSGNWWLGNQALASALEYAGYDVRFVAGEGGHDDVQGAAILPDALRWLWRDWTHPIEASRGKAGAERHIVTEILDPAAGWQVVSQGHDAAIGIAVDPRGDVYFADQSRRLIHRVDNRTGTVGVFNEGSGGAVALAFGRDGRLYAAQSDRRRIVAYAPGGSEAVIAEDIEADRILVGANGELWCTEPRHRRLWYVDTTAAKRVVQERFAYPSGLALSPDHALLAVADALGRWVWSFQPAPDGSLRNGEPFYRLETGDDSAASGAGGMTVDTEGFLYVATRLGIQVFDQAGRLNAIIDAPPEAVPAGLAFGGPDLDTLYLTSVNKVFRRHLRRKGVFPWQIARLPAPRL